MRIEHHDYARHRRNYWDDTARAREIIVLVLVPGEEWIDSIELNTDSWN